MTRWWMTAAMLAVIIATLLASAFGNVVWTFFTLAVLFGFLLAVVIMPSLRRGEPGDTDET